MDHVTGAARRATRPRCQAKKTRSRPDQGYTFGCYSRRPKFGVSAAQVVLAWLRCRPVSVIPTIGAHKLSRVEDNLHSVDVTPSPAQLRRLDAAGAVSLGFPHNFLTRDPVRAIVFGGLRDWIKA